MPPAADNPVPLDALIFGGGVAGLWILDELRRAGHSVLLIESQALGQGQTVWSQGIIHGGLKYTLTGLMNPSAEAIRDMPQIWRECLKGEREPDLSTVRLRAAHCHLWQTASLLSRAGMIGARIGLKVAPVTLSDDERPVPLRNCPGTVARLDEQVIDVIALLHAFAQQNTAHLIAASPDDIELLPGTPGVVRHVRLSAPARDSAITLAPRRLILAAGAGNGPLRERLGLLPNRMQIRPLHMTLLRAASDRLPSLNGHCVDGNRTRVTITSDTDSAGRTIWQVGGQVAEEGVTMSPEALIAHVRRELAAVLPGFDLAAASPEWSTYRADRAELASAAGRRPDDVSVVEDDGVLTVWPTKLALAPRLATAMVNIVAHAFAPALNMDALAPFKRPHVALPPWETAPAWWSNRDIAPRA